MLSRLVNSTGSLLRYLNTQPFLFVLAWDWHNLHWLLVAVLSHVLIYECNTACTSGRLLQIAFIFQPEC